MIYKNGYGGIIGLGLIVVVFVPHVAQAQDRSSQALTLRYAIELALSQNDRVLAAQVGVRRAKSVRDTTRSLYFPSISLSAASVQTELQTTLNLDPLRQIIVDLHSGVPSSQIPPFQFELSRRFDIQTGQVIGKWPVFTGGRIQAANRASKLGVEDATLQQDAIRDSVIADVVVRYYGLRLAQEALAVRDSAFEVVERHLNKARLLETHGQISRAERLRAEVARAEALRDHNAAVREVALARLALRAVLRLSSDSDLMALTPFMQVDDLPAVQHFTSAAQQNNPGLQRLKMGRKMAQQGVAAQRGNLFPQIAVLGFHQLYQNNLTKYVNLKPVWSIGVVANWDVFDGLKRPKAIQAARLLEKEIQYREQQAQRDIGTLVEQLYNRLLDAEGELTVFDSAGILASESLRAQETAFSNGLATSLDVLDAQLSLSRVRLGRLAALYAYHQALVRLFQASGDAGRILEYMELSDNENSISELSHE